MKRAYILTEEEMAKLTEIASSLTNVTYNVEVGKYTEEEALKSVRIYTTRLHKVLRGGS